MFMAAKLVKPSIPTSHLVPQIPKITKMIISQTAVPATHPWTKFTRFGDCPSGSRPIYSIKVAEQSSNTVEDEKEIKQQDQDKTTLAQLKTDLYLAIQGINRGIFGVTAAKKSEIEGLVALLESQNPTPDPALNLDGLGGCWKLIYSTVTILGSKRTKLGLRDFITLGDFLQTIDVAESKAVNVIKFSARGLSLLKGQLRIEASFKIASRSRVDISLDNSKITPDQLMNVFRKNYDILLGIFNPEGWLEITYVDETMSIERDDKGNIFILERLEEIDS